MNFFWNVQNEYSLGVTTVPGVESFLDSFTMLLEMMLDQWFFKVAASAAAFLVWAAGLAEDSPEV